MRTATFIKDLRDGKHKLYKCTSTDSYRDQYALLPEYVVVSVANFDIGLIKICETYIFEADKDGEIVSWSELEGSQKDMNRASDGSPLHTTVSPGFSSIRWDARASSDICDHEKVLIDLGYTIVQNILKCEICGTRGTADDITFSAYKNKNCCSNCF